MINAVTKDAINAENIIIYHRFQICVEMENWLIQR